MRSFGIASAPGKVILFGEHFVVYGSTAILSSIDKRITVTVATNGTDNSRINSGSSQWGGISDQISQTEMCGLIHDAVNRAFGDRKRIGLDIFIRTDIPIGIGLGSSAALCVATIASVKSLFEKPEIDQICELAKESERLVHTNTSGADCYVSTHGGLVSYSKSGVGRINRAKESLSLIVGDTGIAHSTGDMVSKVRMYKDNNENRFLALSEMLERISRDSTLALAKGDYSKVGQFMDENQLLLDEIGVTHPKAKEIIRIAKGAGALGAKVTGAGGGGAVIALAFPKDADFVLSKIRDAHYSSFESKFNDAGVWYY